MGHPIVRHERQSRSHWHHFRGHCNRRNDRRRGHGSRPHRFGHRVRRLVRSARRQRQRHRPQYQNHRCAALVGGGRSRCRGAGLRPAPDPNTHQFERLTHNTCGASSAEHAARRRTQPPSVLRGHGWHCRGRSCGRFCWPRHAGTLQHSARAGWCALARTQNVAPPTTYRSGRHYRGPLAAHHSHQQLLPNRYRSVVSKRLAEIVAATHHWPRRSRARLHIRRTSRSRTHRA